MKSLQHRVHSTPWRFAFFRTSTSNIGVLSLLSQGTSAYIKIATFWAGIIVNFGVCCQLDDAILRFSFQNHILKHETSNKKVHKANLFSIGLEKLHIIVDKTNKISFFYLLED